MSKHDCSPLTLGAAHVAQSDDVSVLGVQLSSDLSLDKHVNVVHAKCFFQLRQLRRIRLSFDDDSVATLVHAFITSRQVVLSACPYQFGLIHVKSESESAGSHPLLNSIAVTHCWTLAITANCTFSGLQCMYS